MPRLVLLCLLFATSCASARSGHAPAPAGTELRYQVKLAADLASIDVTLCFRGPMFGGLIPGRAEAGKRLRSLAWSSGAEGALAIQDGRIPIAGTQREGCLRYMLDLSEGGDLSALVMRVNGHLVASPNVWLWRPVSRPLKLEATLTLELPVGVHASLPFVPLSGREGAYSLPDSLFAFDSHAAFGRFDEHVIHEAGVRAHSVLLGSFPGLDDQGIERWLRDALRIGASSDGRFPASALHVIVIPAKSGNEPFGSIARGGGASVLLFVPESFDAQRLSRDWVLPHELSHLLLPFVKHEDAWLAEGLATYYQEVLRARAGIIPEQEALSNIAEALRSAQHEGTGRSLCEESRVMHQTHAYRAVYWGGAGSLLMADLALREESAGRVTLDGLLTRLRSEARMAPAYSAQELLVRLDELAGSQVLRALGARCAQRAFPDFEPTLRALGVDAQGRVQTESAVSARRAQLFGTSNARAPRASQAQTSPK